MRVIDADALRSLFDERYDDAYMQSLTRPNIAYWEGYSSGVNWGRNTITDATTVDAVEVVHGQWFSLTDCSNAGVYCSVCHKKVWKEDYAWCNRKNKLRSNYCPNCGAKMDLKGE